MLVEDEETPLLVSHEPNTNTQNANDCRKGFSNCIKTMSPVDWLFLLLFIFIIIIGITLYGVITK